VRGGEPLERTAEPARRLRRLLKLRSRLVHPKLQPERPAGGATVDPPDFEDFNPSDAARYLVAVAQTAGWLLTPSSSPGSRVDIVVAMIDQERQFFLDFGTFGGEPVPDLFREAINRRRAQAEPPVVGA
jgi:hypothetical protein